jgi:putative DNA-invertase from lambdoid prophage Rac
MRAAIYARVSTSDQNCDLQRAELQEHIRRRGWVPAGEYVDSGWSGSRSDRPDFSRLMEDAERRRFDAVLVWKLDRFGRSVRHCVTAIETLRSLGIRFLAVSQGIDTDESNPGSRLMLHILAAVAEFERELIRERVVAGLKTARARGTRSGRRIGRPRAVFRRDDVVRLRQRGLSWSEIAREVGAGATTVRRVYEAAGLLSGPAAACQNPVTEAI